MCTYIHLRGFHEAHIKITTDKITVFRSTFFAKILRAIACEIEKVQKLTTTLYKYCLKVGSE